MASYYNEFDKRSAAWLRELIGAGLIAPGDVDERSIVDVKGSELVGYDQVHLFAGIGGWSYALRFAGVPDEFPVWTGSCPCQPFSSAGKRKGFADSRHLWPEMFRLISECGPGLVFGEQVASKDGLLWFDGVCADLEGADYAVWATDCCAAGVGAPHIRQRLYWLADAEITQRRGYGCSHNTGRWNAETRRHRGDSRLGIPKVIGRIRRKDDEDGGRRERSPGHTGERGPWDDYELIPCGDGKSRRIEPGLVPLVDGLPGRVGLLRGYGNAIVPYLAAEFVKNYFEAVRG